MGMPVRGAIFFNHSFHLREKCTGMTGFDRVPFIGFASRADYLVNPINKQKLPTKTQFRHWLSLNTGPSTSRRGISPDIS